MSTRPTPLPATGGSRRPSRRFAPHSDGTGRRPGATRSRVAVIGAGVAGLTAALLLAEHGGIDVDVYETATVAGGRANVVDDAEHCQRIFLSDYHEMLAVLRRIPSNDQQSVAETLTAARRLVRGPDGGLVEISHPYYVFAREFSLREKFRLLAESRRSVLAARAVHGPNTNFLGAPKNRYSLRTKFAVLRNFVRNQTVLVLPDRTDVSLTDPWVAHLRHLGVRMHFGRSVHRLTARSEHVELCTTGAGGVYDVVVCTGFVADLAALLDSSQLASALPSALHAHCACHTIRFADDERSPYIANVALVSAHGLGVVIQPAARRCTVLCVRSVRHDSAWVLERVTELLELTSAPTSVLTRTNEAPGEGLFVGDHVDAERITHEPRIVVAGSWTRQRYPVDSGEAAVQSALRAVQRVTALVEGRVM